MADNDPPQIAVMESILGTAWSPQDNKPCTAAGEWLTYIADHFPNMASYCNSVIHQVYFSWCGLAVGYSVAKSGIAPVYGKTATDQFLWAKAWLEWGKAVTDPIVGDVLIFDFGGGDQHVTLFHHDAGNGLWACIGGNQFVNGTKIHEVTISSYPKQCVIGIRRPPAAGQANAGADSNAAAAAASPAASAPGAASENPRNYYPEKPVVAYARTTLGTADIAQYLTAKVSEVNIARAVYVLVCNESANGKAGINGNYAGLQADVGRWSAAYDNTISATCVVKDSGGSVRRFLCFDKGSDCLDMVVGIVKTRGLYVGGTTTFIINTTINSPDAWAEAYYREWVTGEATATIPVDAKRSLLSLYANAEAAIPAAGSPEPAAPHGPANPQPAPAPAAANSPPAQAPAAPTTDFLSQLATRLENAIARIPRPTP